MKKVLPMSLVALVSVSLLAPMAVQAADPATTADVSFTEGDSKPPEVNKSQTLIKPGTLDPISPKTGQNSEGLLRFEFVPNLTFETTKLATGAKHIKSHMLTFLPKKENPAKPGEWMEDTTAKEAYIPAFVQVSDIRGDATGGFKVSVKQDEQFKNQGGASVLTGAEIRFGEKPKLFNTTKDSMLETNLDVGAGIKVGEAKEIMNTKKDESSISTTSSIVFKGDYTPEAYGEGKTEVIKDDKTQAIQPKIYDGIYLHIPGTTSVLKTAYSTTLTWSAVDAK